MQGPNQNMHQVPAGQPQLMTSISSKEFKSKYNSKRECYNFLASEVGVYLPPFFNVTSK